ncbi:glycosyltransferase [Sphingomonas sp. RRHST34]|uniref:Glycosyltransferase n=1 Tax=Sphingomonas citri TaxID=2862499 RepID=A0ABS7BQA3_9SPHN|nr:glycosyltransferase [Sphingomonas citri]MBW6531657.1 glycosyltransferase [Sphingomonas citri]
MRPQQDGSVMTIEREITAAPPLQAHVGTVPIAAGEAGAVTTPLRDEAEWRAQFAGLRVAIVHYWLVGPGGGENVVKTMLRIFPQAVVHTLVADPDYSRTIVPDDRLRTSFLQKIPGAARFHRSLLPVAPMALENLDLDGYDLIISSESGPAKGIMPPLNAVHVCYCHSPMRYLWDQYHHYRRDASALKRLVLSITVPRLRLWDVGSALRVDRFVANSRYVASRIARYYRRPAEVIYPPVEVDDFATSPEIDDYYLITGRHVSYKRVDLAIAACNRLGRRLVITGKGPETAALRKLAGPTIEFVGQCSFAELKRYYARARAFLMPGEEDFGIAPVEAMASGRPVIAYASGGATETVVPGLSGLHFAEQSVDSLVAAIETFERDEAGFDQAAIRTHALSFSRERFLDSFARFVAAALAARGTAAGTFR